MPHIIRTPEDIFRAEKRDIYALHWLDNGDDIEWIRSSVFENIWAEMAQWFAQHMPDSPTEFMACSEHSGIIAGGPISLRIAFTDTDLQRFCQIWETPDGKSLDPRFQCYQHSYQAWWNKHGRYQPTLAQPQGPGVSVWIATPIGILCHVLTDPTLTRHPATARDLWVHAQEQWPELASLNLEDLRYGRVIRKTRRFRHRPSSEWLLIWNAPFKDLLEQDEDKRQHHWRNVIDWLRLPEDTETNSEF